MPEMTLAELELRVDFAKKMLRRIQWCRMDGSCPNVERVQRWTDGRYYCDKVAGHYLNSPCSCWSRSSRGRVALADPVHPLVATPDHMPPEPE